MRKRLKKLRRWAWLMKDKIERYPLRAFFSLIFLLLLLIILGTILRKPTIEPKPAIEVKKVEVYRIGTAPKISSQAQIQKSGVITISSQAPGIVRAISVKEGQSVGRGRVLVSLATNYYGGSAASVARQLSEKQYQQVQDTFDLQKDLIGKQREAAEKTDSNSDELREISRKSIDEIKTLLSLNEDIVGTLDKNIQALIAANVGGINDALILAAKQQKSQFLAAVNQLRSQLRSTEYQVDENKPPAQLSNLQKDVVFKQLDIQEKSLALSLEISRLQVQLARINEGIMYPAAPFVGTIERIHVRLGQQVNPGTPLVTFSGTNQHYTAVALVPEKVAFSISRTEPSIVLIGGRSLLLYPDFIATEATHGQLYQVIYTIPPEYFDPPPDGSFTQIEIPVGYADTGSTIPFVPLDSVFQTQEKAYVFVVEGDKAASREVKLGSVLGRFVEVESGLKAGDEVILDRSVIGGQVVEKLE